MINYGLKDKVAIITGANNPWGIGATTALAFAREGAKVVLIYKKVFRPFDENKLEAELRYEDGDNCGREYPHVYGMINNDAVMTVLPFIKDKDGVWQKNPEFSDIQDK